MTTDERSEPDHDSLSEAAQSKKVSTKWRGYLDATLGFRNHWNPVGYGHEIAEGAFLAVTALDEPILLTRVDGEVRAIQDRCAHRGARFSAQPLCLRKGALVRPPVGRHPQAPAVVKDHIAPLILARNALTHGGWDVAMTPDGSTVDGTRTATIKKYTLFHITNERNLIDHFTWIIHDLVITRYAYDRDFDRKIADVDAARGRATKSREQSWEKMLQDRYDRRPKRLVK
jgi:hypothetical protein